MTLTAPKCQVVGLRSLPRSRTSDEYFLAGRKMGCIPVGISASSALFSGITFLGAPAYTFAHGMAMSLQLTAFFAAIPLTAAVFVPLFHRHKLTTAYELLEIRFGLSIRLMSSALFIFRVMFYLAIVLYAPALALAAVSPLPFWACVFSAGALSAGYTVSGGLRAVIWTDVFQFFVLWGGCLLLAGYAASYTQGGLGTALELAFAESSDRPGICMSLKLNTNLT